MNPRRPRWRAAAIPTAILATAVAGSVACGARTPHESPDAVSARVLPDRVSYSAYAAAYRAVTRRHVEQVFNGQVTETQFAMTYYLSVRVVETADGLRASLTVDSVPELVGLPASEAAAVVGSRFVAGLSPSGTPEDFQPEGPGGADLHRQISLRLQEFFPRLPRAGASPGDRWIDTVETDAGSRDIALTVHSINRSEALSWEPWGGTPRALHIATVSDYSVVGTGVQAGQDLTLEGTGRAHAHQYLSPEGRFLGMAARDTLRSRVSLSALGLDIPITQTSADTLELLP